MRLKNANRWLKNETKRWTSTLKKLRDQELIDESFEIMLANLTLEDIIAVKLELSSKTLHSPVYGVILYKSLIKVVKDAVLKYIVSTTRSTVDAAAALGISQRQLFELTKKYGLETYYDPYVAKKAKEGLWNSRLRKSEESKNRLLQQQTEETINEQKTNQNNTNESGNT